jgi:SAM-dependent methyltransferase
MNQTLDRLIARVDERAWKARPYVPFTALNTVWRSLDKQAQSILDVGCGQGGPMKFINRHKRFYTVGVDIFEPYMSEGKRQGIHDEYVLCDVRKLPFPRKSFDIVLCMEVLEHLEREAGLKLLASLEEIARKQVIISTPVGRYKQRPYDQNPHQEHKTIWSPNELKRLGYQVRGHGIRKIGGREGLVSRLPAIVQPLGYIIWIVAGPLVHFLPGLAGDMVCIKQLD